MLPTANGRGSTISRAPNFFASTVPAPKRISPCVTVGPSSTTSTVRPVTAAGRSAVTGEAASTITASALAVRM
jgi:hypothetical protein